MFASLVRRIIDWFFSSEKGDTSVPVLSAPSVTVPAEGISKTDPSQSEGDQAAGEPRSAYLPSLQVYDEHLLTRARTQWEFGDWASLAAIDLNDIKGHPERAQLALMAAAGRLQSGRVSEGREFASLASEWGVSRRQLSQVLVSGVFNSLGRVALVAEGVQRAKNHFETAVRIGAPEMDKRLLAAARVEEQARQLRIPAPLRARIQSAFDDSDPRTFSLTTLDCAALGNAWAGNTINTVIFRHHGVFTHENIQYAAFYVDIHTLRVVTRQLSLGTIEIHDISGEYNLRDAHNSISLGLDREGFLHISYDHHATNLRYRRSLEPLSICKWSDELPMTGAFEDRVTYPTFILPRQGYPLTLLYRDGLHNKGSARIKTYDETTQSWADHPSAILSGSEQKPWTSNAYWNHPAVGSDGSLHLSFVWRTDTLGPERLINNINIGYACSYDNGHTWQTSRGQPYRLPITQVNAETVHPVSPGSNLINQSSMALDRMNRPHVVFYSDDEEGIPQYQHLWFDGKGWRHHVISTHDTRFSLMGGGTLQIPISRPEIVIDGHDNVYVIVRGAHTQNRMIVTCLAYPDYAYQPLGDMTLVDENLGFAEPVIDRMRWQAEGILTMLIQRNEQPSHDSGVEDVTQPISLRDFRIVPVL